MLRECQLQPECTLDSMKGTILYLSKLCNNTVTELQAYMSEVKASKNPQREFRWVSRLEKHMKKNAQGLHVSIGNEYTAGVCDGKARYFTNLKNSTLCRHLKRFIQDKKTVISCS